MPVDLSLEDAEEKLQVAAAAVINDDDERDGEVPAVKRQRTECYTSAEPDAVKKVKSVPGQAWMSPLAERHDFFPQFSGDLVLFSSFISLSSFT